MFQPSDLRHYAPATERNRAPIYSVLTEVLPSEGTVLEIASGTGQHAAFLAPKFSPKHWLPSDPNPDARSSIQAWIDHTESGSLHPPLDLDVTQPDWTQQVADWFAAQNFAVPPISAIVNINMIHISPWNACEGLLSGAGTLLPEDGILYLYGPFKREGQHTAPSNAAFDRALQSQNSAWGVRNLEDVAAIAHQHSLQLSKVISMPANNLSVVFQR